MQDLLRLCSHYLIICFLQISVMSQILADDDFDYIDVESLDELLFYEDFFDDFTTLDPDFVGNGGDVVVCEVDRGGTTVYELFFLDYAVKYHQYQQEIDLGDDNVLSILNRVKSVIASIDHELFLSLDNFTKSFLHQNSNHYYLWNFKKSGLGELRDEELLVKDFPSECMTKGRGFPGIKQAVIRLKIGGNIHHFIDDKIIKYFESNSPLQLSFLIVHEWLWNYIEDPREIRELNWLLHSFSSQETEFLKKWYLKQLLLKYI